jgi:hypothetical protein
MEDQAFFYYTIRLLAHPSSLPLFSSARCLFRFSWGSTVELTDGSGCRGWVGSRIKRPRESLVHYKSLILSASLLSTLPSSTRFDRNCYVSLSLFEIICMYIVQFFFLLTLDSRAILFIVDCFGRVFMKSLIF